MEAIIIVRRTPPKIVSPITSPLSWEEVQRASQQPKGFFGWLRSCFVKRYVTGAPAEYPTEFMSGDLYLWEYFLVDGVAYNLRPYRGPR